MRTKINNAANVIAVLGIVTVMTDLILSYDISSDEKVEYAQRMNDCLNTDKHSSEMTHGEVFDVLQMTHKEAENVLEELYSKELIDLSDLIDGQETLKSILDERKRVV